jgi:hypothetical protein
MNKKRFSGAGLLKMSLFGIIVVSGFSALVLLLWNLLIPGIFGLKTINFWQAGGLFILIKILFSSFRGGGNPRERMLDAFQRDNPMMEKWIKMTEEERKEFINKRREFLHRGSFSRKEFFNSTTTTTENDETSRKDK